MLRNTLCDVSSDRSSLCYDAPLQLHTHTSDICHFSPHIYICVICDKYQVCGHPNMFAYSLIPTPEYHIVPLQVNSIQNNSCMQFCYTHTPSVLFEIILRFFQSTVQFDYHPLSISGVIVDNVVDNSSEQVKKYQQKCQIFLHLLSQPDARSLINPIDRFRARMRLWM